MTNVNVIEILDFISPLVSEFLVAFLSIKVYESNLMVGEKLFDQKIHNESSSWSMLIWILVQKIPIHSANILIRVQICKAGFHAPFVMNTKSTVEELFF